MAKTFDRVEHCRRIASAGGKAMKAKHPQSPMKGKRHSQASRAKMSASRTGRRKEGALEESAKARGRRVARALYPLPDQCELCPAPATDRHHKDGDTDNNRKGNIQFLCHPCHTRIDNPKHRSAEPSQR